jgi:integrase
MSFGSYDLVRLAEAREKRDTARKQVANSIDPVEERKAQKMTQQLSTQNSFEAICREWHLNKADRWTVAYREEIIKTFELGYKGRATGHGFRQSMSTILHEQGFDSAWIEMQLTHVDNNSIRGTYNHAQYIEKRRCMLQWYADTIPSSSSSSSS